LTSPAASTEPEVSRAFIEAARQFLKYEYLPKIERCLERLTDEQIWWRPNEESNSIGNLLLHLCGNARQWIVSSLGSQTDARDRDSEFAARGSISREKLLSRLRRTIADVDDTLARFDAQKLLDEYQIQGTNSTALAAIFHVTEHFSMHTGQIILLTKMLANVELDFYDFATGKPMHTWHEPRA
jgi:uncharacterized damage-inducible protein DinB